MSTRVLLVITVPMQAEGITLSSLRYVERMDRDRVEVTFLAKNGPDDGIKRRVKDAGAALKVIKGRNEHPLRYLRELTRFIRDGRFDAVHARGSSSTLALEMLAARLGGAKKRVAHSDNSFSKHGTLHRLLRPFMLALCNRRLACGAEAGRWMFGKKPFEVLNIGVDCDQLAFDENARDEVRREWGFDENARVMGCVANLTGAKNHSFLLKAFKEVVKRDDSARLALVGGGKLREQLENEADALGISPYVLFTGTRSDIPRVLSACDVMALPSLYEGFPSVLLEWQCSGLPAVVSDRVTESANVSGLLRYLPIDDPALWAEALLDADTSNRQENSKKGAEAVKNAGYGILENAKRLQDIYLEAEGHR